MKFWLSNGVVENNTVEKDTVFSINNDMQLMLAAITWNQMLFLSINSQSVQKVQINSIILQKILIVNAKHINKDDKFKEEWLNARGIEL